tara:strand:+ start:274 stop:804 length:531 start_codon:yes stop_codon:yes gene_type:complete
MKLLSLKLFIVIIYLLSSNISFAIEKTNLKNLIIYKEPRDLKNIIFKDSEKQVVDLANYKNKLVILNFWATWCMPCREELPSLNLLKQNNNFKNLEIFPINVSKEDMQRINTFWAVLNINHLKIYLDPKLRLPDKFNLRGIPTTIFINKKGEEFGRVVGYIDFNDEEFVKWLKNFD